MKIDNKNLEWVVSLWKIWPFLDENTPKALSYKEIHNLLNSCNCCFNNAIAYLKKVEIIESTEGSNTSFVLSSTSVEVIHDMNIPITYSASKMNTDTSISRESNWTSFRKMVKYYIDCIAIDSDYSTRLNAKYLNNKFCFMNSMPYDWIERSDKDICLKFTKQQVGLRDRLSQLDSIHDYEMYIGYPVMEITSYQNNSKFYSPLLLFPVEHSSQKTYDYIPSEYERYVHLDYDHVKINTSWIEYSVGYEFQKEIYEDLDKNYRYNEYPYALKHIEAAIHKVVAATNFNDVGIDPNNINSFVDSKASKRGGRRVSNSVVLLRADSSRYNKNLVRELKCLADPKITPASLLDNSSLAYIYREPPLQSEREDKTLTVPFIASNEEQSNALDIALNNYVSTIQGPPGTGKSQVAVNIIANNIYHDRSVLFTSKNHAAINAIKNRSNNLINNLVLFCNADEGERIPWYKDKIEDYTFSYALNCDANNHAVFVQIDNTLKDIQEIKIEIEKYCNAEEEWRAANRQLDKLQDNINSLKYKLFGDASIKDATIEETIKILSKYKTGFFCSLKKKLKTRSYISDINHVLDTSKVTRRDFCNDLDGLFESLKVLKSIDNELVNINDKVLKYRIAFEAMAKNNNGFKEYREYYDKLALLTKGAFNSKVNQIAKSELEDEVYKNKSTEFRYEPLKKIQASEMDEVSYALKCLHQRIPAWSTTLLSMYLASPLIPGVFDQLIIDEASQCDACSIIPALFRSKSVVMIGDPQQFKPIVNIPKNSNLSLLSKSFSDSLSKNRYVYTKATAYSIVEKQSKNVMLKEHFRCNDEIGRLFSDLFYSGKLRLRGSETLKKVPSNLPSKEYIQWYECDDSIDSMVEKTVELYLSIKESGYDGTIGIICPLRDIVYQITNKLSACYAINEADTIINTSYAFQGGEMDTVIFVTGLYSELSKGRKWYLCSSENSELYNVTISRAVASFLIVGNKDVCLNSSSKELRAIASYKPVYSNVDTTLFESPIEEKLYYALLKRNIKTIPQKPVRGYRLDLAYVEDGVYLDIEADGKDFHTDSMGDRKQEDIIRNEALASAGWAVIRFWGSEINRDVDYCVDRVIDAINAEKQKLRD